MFTGNFIHYTEVYEVYEDRFKKFKFVVIIFPFLQSTKPWYYGSLCQNWHIGRTLEKYLFVDWIQLNSI